MTRDPFTDPLPLRGRHVAPSWWRRLIQRLTRR